MTRTTPDGVFAEAARAELLHRVRAGSAPARRPFVVEAVVAVAVVAIAVAVVLGVQRLHAGPVDQGPPAAPLPTASSTLVSPTPTASPTVARSLIGSPGAKPRTEAEIRAWGANEGLGEVMIEQDVIQARCMQQHGFVYDPIYENTADLRAGHSGMTAADEAAWNEALGGPDTTAAYDWRTAGCRGLAVHETGQDGAH